MVLKLSQINGFNDNFNIRGTDGEYIQNTNIAKLLSLTQHRIRTQKGVPELINLLYEAKIDPNIIHNEGIKAKLLELYSSAPNGNNESNVNNNNNNNNGNTESNFENINEETMDTANESETEQILPTPTQDKSSSTQTTQNRISASTQTSQDRVSASTQTKQHRKSAGIQTALQAPRNDGSSQTPLQAPK